MIRGSIMALALVSACGGKGGDPTFTRVNDEVLVVSCGFSSCHGSGTGDLTLDGDGSYDALVDVESVAAPGEILVVPGDPDASYLIMKLEGADGVVGTEMPPGALIDEERRTLVRDWIAAGALND